MQDGIEHSDSRWWLLFGMYIAQLRITDTGCSDRSRISRWRTITAASMPLDGFGAPPTTCFRYAIVAPQAHSRCTPIRGSRGSNPAMDEAQTRRAQARSQTHHR